MIGVKFQTGTTKEKPVKRWFITQTLKGKMTKCFSAQSSWRRNSTTTTSQWYRFRSLHWYQLKYTQAHMHTSRSAWFLPASSPEQCTQLRGTQNEWGLEQYLSQLMVLPSDLWCQALTPMDEKSFSLTPGEEEPHNCALFHDWCRWRMSYWNYAIISISFSLSSTALH